MRRIVACRDTGTNGDCCRPAVERAFRELREKGQPERYCLEAALTVYRWHHPETPEAQAAGIVAGWVEPEAGTATAATRH